MTRSPAQYAAQLTAGQNPSESLSLRLADFNLLVRSNSRALIDELVAYFRSFIGNEADETEAVVIALEAAPPVPDLALSIKQPDPGKTKIKEEYADLAEGRIVRKRLTGLLFLFGGETNLAVGPCLANANQVINFINNRFIQRELAAGCLLAHAAAVAGPERGLALAGFSGMGKSTLALWLTGRGFNFISNDRLLVKRRTGRAAMSGVAKQPRINPGTALANPDLADIVPPADRERFAQLPSDELWSLEHKYDAFIEDCFGPGRFRLAADLDGLAILNWRRNGEPCRVRPVDLSRRPDLLGAFKKEPGLFYLPPGLDGRGPVMAPDKDYLAALEGVTVFEVGGGVDFHRAADELSRFLTGE